MSTSINPQVETDRPRASRLWQAAAVKPLVGRLEAIRNDMLMLEANAQAMLEAVVPRRRESARNLLHYVALRRHDLRELQEQLVPRGLSSLGRCEANALATISAVIDALHCLSGVEPAIEQSCREMDFVHSRELSIGSTTALFGESPPESGAHIMVTMPSEAANDASLIADLLAGGMDCMRVNCAHDKPSAWLRMIENLRAASREQGRACKVCMDLAGPKLRTGPIVAGPAIVKWRPHRDSLGRVLLSARIWMHREDARQAPPFPADAELPIAGRWIDSLQPGNEIHLTDARGRKRSVRVTERGYGGLWGESDRTSYITPGTKLERIAPGAKPKQTWGRVGALQPSQQFLVVRRGDSLLLGDEFKIGSPAKYDEYGQLLQPASIGCTLPSVFRDLKRGERVLFDDGKIGASVQLVGEYHVVLEVVHAAKGGAKLKADKGINLPDTELHLDALTAKDIDDLKFIVEHADMVGYSFVRRAEDVQSLHDALDSLGRPDMPTVLKIENRQAFERLPSLLMASMRSTASGVMIARGDLAVELGWERLAEVQEEILWMCEAAHMPVVWATQVLESLAKTGMPSRAEITDAAMSVRAECVMLNKGPHILETVHLLTGILRRMKGHQAKKRPLLRRLRLADDLLPTTQ